MPIKTITEMINEGILPDDLPKRTTIPNPINKDSWKSKTSGSLAQKKNMIRNKYGRLVEQKPLGTYTPREQRIINRSLENRSLKHTLMKPVVSPLTNNDIISKWKEDRAKLEELRKWRSKKEDDEKAKRKGLVVDKKSING